ncbi:SLAP domain-containing protein, partial [Lactobacillus gallinarum]|uniref:SLAP domain-containing protein n=2 Tax=Lactobacillus TaxID=1578 RepID=UPI002431539B
KKDSKKTTTKKSSAKKTTKKTTSKKSSKIKVVKISMKKKAYVYDNNGKRVKNYLGTSYIGKDVTVKGLGTKTIKGTKYYALKPNHYYVKASDVTVK